MMRIEIQGMLAWFGIQASWRDCDICENGDVYFGLTKIGSLSCAN